MYRTILLVIYLHVLFERCSSNLDIIPERTDIVYINDKYLENVIFNVRRYSRKSPYVFNVAAKFKQSWTNNVTLNIFVYEYLHNEYKRTFIEFHYKMCDFVNKDDFIGKRLKLFGLTCPFPVGDWKLSNVTLAFPAFPQVFPLTKGKAELIFVRTGTEEIFAQGNLYVSIKQIK